MRERIVYLAGAGLARNAGLPTSVELAERLKDTLRDLIKDDQVGLEETEEASRLLAVFRFLSGGVRFQEGFLNRDPDRAVNIEQIAVAALSIQNRLSSPVAPYTSGWHQRLIEFEQNDTNLMPSFIEFIYSKLAVWLAHEDDASISYLQRIFDLLDTGRAVDIFSLNYDLCIERAAGARPSAEFRNGFTKSGWSPDTLEADPDIRLFKLHGSLDWIEDETYGVCSLEYPRHTHAEDIEGTQRPLLIFGTNEKLSARQPFLTLAYYFSQAVMQTRVLVVIGYSFGDEYVNEIIEQGFRTNTRLRVIIVSPDAQNIADASPMLRGSPKVSCLDLDAKIALNDGKVRELIEQQLEESSSDDVF